MGYFKIIERGTNDFILTTLDVAAEGLSPKSVGSALDGAVSIGGTLRYNKRYRLAGFITSSPKRSVSSCRTLPYTLLLLRVYVILNAR